MSDMDDLLRRAQVPGALERSVLLTVVCQHQRSLAKIVQVEGDLFAIWEYTELAMSWRHGKTGRYGRSTGIVHIDPQKYEGQSMDAQNTCCSQRVPLSLVFDAMARGRKRVAAS